MALGGLPVRPINPEVLNLPGGFQGACAIITMVGHQVHGIVSLAALSDTRILVGYEKPEPGPAPQNDPLEELKILIGKLAVSNSPPAPRVQSVTMRLYYDRDAISIATVVQSAFSQLKVQPVSMNPAFGYRDSIVIADPTGTGSVEALDQARRMVAQLDEPRAQVVVNAWSLQISKDQKAKGDELVPQARRLAGSYNDALEGAIFRGWRYINKVGNETKDDTGKSLTFDQHFAGYLCNTFTFAPAGHNPSRMTTFAPAGPCPQDPDLSYGLGYTTLFGQEDPDLIQMLILVMATTNPAATIWKTLNVMEGRDPDVAAPSKKGEASEPSTEDCCSCQERNKAFYLSQQQLQTASLECTMAACKAKEQDDRSRFYKNATEQIAPRYVAFNCTRAKLKVLTDSSDNSVRASSFVGQFRAAVADYLFQNKMKAEYPNDFDPFLFPASAATLDAALTPIVEAFNQDLEALQQNLQYQLTNGVGPDKHLHYTSNGLISVKVVSGNQAMAQTQSQNYFPQNPTLSLESFAKNLAAQTSSVPLLAGSLSSVVAATAAYAASQPQQVTAKVGSGLSLTVTPFTLSSAKGAELNVNVTYNENAAATISSDQTQSNATDDLNSRVSEHEVSTLVRMVSLKFFEISTMQSVIARERTPWKPFDPAFELPLLNNPGIVIARRRPEVIYSQSIIFMEASIMPTAADLGQGLIYQSDMIDKGVCPDAKGPRAAHSAQDFCVDESKEQNPLSVIKHYHEQMMAYFGGQYIGLGGTVRQSAYITTLPTIRSQ